MPNTSSFELVKDHLYIVSISHWKSPLYPVGKIEEYLGDGKDIITGSKVVLFNHGVDDTEFDDVIVDDVTKSIQAIQKQPRSADRLDCSHLRVVSIDPVTAKDLDDALSVELLDNDTARVGIHIADVTHYLAPGSAMDNIAKLRTTSVYLPDRVVKMLPDILSEMNAFSVFVDLEIASGKALSFKFTKTFIQPSARLAYGDCQRILVKKGLVDYEPPEHDCLPSGMEIANQNVTEEQIEEDVALLYTISKKLSLNRKENGAVGFSKKKMRMRVDRETFEAIEPIVLQQYEANKLIEEFMLLANASVSKFLSSNLPWSLGRCHECPSEMKLDVIRNWLQLLGTEGDFSDSKSFGQTMLTVAQAYKDGNLALSNRIPPELFEDIFQIMSTKTMNLAKYILVPSLSDRTSTDEFTHYGLSMPFYTHFTSPIRRYPDVIVHRQLSAAIEIDKRKTAGEELSDDDIQSILIKYGVPKKDELSSVVSLCNERKYEARKADDDSYLLWLGNFIKERFNGGVHADAYVISISGNYFDIYIPDYALDTRVDSGAVKFPRVYQLVDDETIPIMKIRKYAFSNPVSKTSNPKCTVFDWNITLFSKLKILIKPHPTEIAQLEYIIDGCEGEVPIELKSGGKKKVEETSPVVSEKEDNVVEEFEELEISLSEYEETDVFEEENKDLLSQSYEEDEVEDSQDSDTDSDDSIELLGDPRI
ncbi:hypothetical protein GEMRC1_001801 [Eukaryota sp. GEM-RC1]